MIRSLLAFAALALAPLIACAQQNDPGYVDVSAYPLTETQYEAWWTLQGNLRRHFDQLCGDTFCEGDFSNIQPLRFRCSVERRSGRIGTCAWIFAASNEEIDPLTGRIHVSERGFWNCRAPVVPGTTIGQFIKALQGEQPLYAPLPKTTKTLMDGLIDCL